MSDSTNIEENKSSLKSSTLKLNSRQFKPLAKKSEPFVPNKSTGVAAQAPIATVQSGFNPPAAPFQIPGAYPYGASTGMPPIGGISSFLPPGATAPPPPPPPVQIPAQKPAPAALSSGSSLKSSMTKASRSFVPKTAKSTVVSAEASEAKAVAPLKLTNKSFTPKTATAAEVTQETPAPVVEKPEEVEATPEVQKEPEVVAETPAEPEPEVKPAETVPEVAPVVEAAPEPSSKYPEPLCTLLANFKKNGKLSINELMAFKDCDVCKCSETPSIYINTNLLNRRTERQTIYSKSYQKGGRGKHQNYNNKNNSHNNFTKGMIKKKSTYGGNRVESSGFERQQISEDVKKLKVQASQIRERLNNHDSSDIEKQTKALFNKITPDNMKRLKEQIRDVLMSCKSKEDRHKFIKVMFKKATHEDKYCSMYTNLITYLGECETDALNKEASHDSSPSKSKSKMRKAKESKFKKDIVVECKSMFEEFATEMNIDNVPEQDREEFEYKYKKQLYGNLKFIAELYKKRLVSKAVCLHVLGNLLGRVGMVANEFTIEGACTFLSRVGEKLEKQVLKSQDGDEEEPATPKDTNAKEDNLRKNQKNAYLQIIETLKNYQQDQNISSRIRIIIQNTMHKRDNNWVENIADEGPKTKKQIREDHLRALQGLDDTSQKKSPKAKKQQTDKNDFPQLELTKMESSTSVFSEYDDDIE